MVSIDSNALSALLTVSACGRVMSKRQEEHLFCLNLQTGMWKTSIRESKSREINYNEVLNVCDLPMASIWLGFVSTALGQDYDCLPCFKSNGHFCSHTWILCHLIFYSVFGYPTLQTITLSGECSEKKCAGFIDYGRSKFITSMVYCDCFICYPGNNDVFWTSFY